MEIKGDWLIQICLIKMELIVGGGGCGNCSILIGVVCCWFVLLRCVLCIVTDVCFFML